jgi:hypothetical protein
MSGNSGHSEGGIDREGERQRGSGMENKRHNLSSSSILVRMMIRKRRQRDRREGNYVRGGQKEGDE